MARAREVGPPACISHRLHLRQPRWVWDRLLAERQGRYLPSRPVQGEHLVGEVLLGRSSFLDNLGPGHPEHVYAPMELEIAKERPLDTMARIGKIEALARAGPAENSVRFLVGA